ncbi:MAG TPA: hypothetical protein ENK18_24865 [Deltaproteobacteria bacterium]|nr:hypothetical protein [Deltaproteobacteria bacterium]
MSDEVISYQPTEGLCYDPSEERYWSLEQLDLEITRVFEVCHGCRMCFKYCDSFPDLFRFLDERHNGDVRKLTADEIESVMDSCFQCKLCEVQCPYTPREAHEFQLDFPKLVHRYKAIRAKQRGLSIRDRVLGRPDGLARLARMSFGLANAMNKVSVHRWFMEKMLGIHRSKQLPDFARRTFERWAAASGRVRGEPGGEVVVFSTCYVNNNDPQIGRDTLEVLDKNQVEASCAVGAGCCGMPAWESGDLEGLRGMARVLLDRLSPHVEAGAKIVVLQPTCAMMLRREYPELIEDPRAVALAEAVVDPGEYLWSIRKEERFNTEFLSSPPGGIIAYHTPCHLRAQAVGFRGRDLMRRIPDTKIKTVMECCGHDGTYAMRVEGFEPAARIGEAAFDGMAAADAEIWASECALAGIQFEQHAGRRAMHPMSVLARAYREDGFRDLPERKR